MASTSALTIGQKDYEDYISLLPDCLIHLIFSFLPTRDVIKTCVLSKRWQFVWTTISDLRFSVSSYHDSFVDRVLSLYVGRKVKKFHLDIMLGQYFCSASKIDSWVHFAINHQVEDLLLDVYIYQHTLQDHCTLYPLLYNCSSLTKLCLRGCHFPFSESISWSSLKSLSIDNVTNDVLQKILMGSPVLEYLNLTTCWCVEGIRIHSRSLRVLVIINANVMRSPLHISTPHLLSLRVRGAHFYEAIRIIEAPSLVEAELDFDGPAESDSCLLKEMLCKLQNATQIIFSAWCLRVMSPLKVEDVQILLLNCKSLTLSMPIPEFSFPAIANMLATAPNLEKLVIIFKPPDFISYISDLDSRNVDQESYWHIKKKFKRWARHLKNVEIFGFYACLRFKYEELLLLVKFLLGHAFVLENMVIKVKNHGQYLELVDSFKLLEVARQLQSYHKASKHAAVILNYLEEVPRKRQMKGVRVTTKCLRIGHKNA